MAKGPQRVTKVAKPTDEGRKNRNFPSHTLEAALVLAQRIQDEMAGKPMNRLLLADALGMSPSSSNFRVLLSSAYKYGLTDGTEKAEIIALTPTGSDATQSVDQTKRLRALRSAALAPAIFGAFFRDYANKRLPSPEMLPKILKSQYNVPPDLSAECAQLISTNGRQVELIRDIGGSPHILMDAELARAAGASTEPPDSDDDVSPPPPPISVQPSAEVKGPPLAASATAAASAPKPIFVGHGKNKAPLLQLQRLLTSFQIPHKVVVDEANLGRPISQKVKETIEECGSAILIFTRDERFLDVSGNEVWRPSENVVHELGATSFAYGDRIVIFKEKGLHFPTNFQSIGYIEFEADDIQARTADLLKELIGFGLVRVTPT
jgi:predicted nucleotide-binding protein